MDNATGVSNTTSNSTMMNVTWSQNNTVTYDKEHCHVDIGFLWFKTTIDCTSVADLFTVTNTATLAHCWKYNWISWIFGNKFTCDYLKIDPYEVD